MTQHRCPSCGHLVSRNQDYLKMTDVEAMDLIASLRSEVGQLKSENKRLRKKSRP